MEIVKLISYSEWEKLHDLCVKAYDSFRKYAGKDKDESSPLWKAINPPQGFYEKFNEKYYTYYVIDNFLIVTRRGIEISFERLKDYIKEEMIVWMTNDLVDEDIELEQMLEISFVLAHIHRLLNMIESLQNKIAGL